MPVPDFQSFLLPMLQLAGDGGEHTLTDAKDALALKFNLSESERDELLPSGRQRRFDNRVSWAKVYLQRAGLLTSDRRAHFRISDRGREVLTEPLQDIDVKFLKRFPEFLDFHRGGDSEDDDQAGESGDVQKGSSTPEEILEHAYQRIRTELASELLTKVKSATPSFFETLVVELLLKMGYGRNRADAGRAIGASGDEGIDGLISEDRLGLDTIYIQAKRWQGSVGRPEIQKFVGALHGKRARKGVFLTTGTFSPDAKDYVSQIDPRVVLIDGQQLAEYMIDYNLGVTPRASYELKRVDSDYFVEE